MPSSKVKEALAEILHKEGYIEGYQGADNTERPGRVLHIKMKYSPERARVISGLRRVSKPGLRVYSQSTKVPRVFGGLGVAVLSNSQGPMTDREARHRPVGGELLSFELGRASSWASMCQYGSIHVVGFN